MEVNRDPKKSPTPTTIEEIAPWLAPMMNGGKKDTESPDSGLIDYLRMQAIQHRKHQCQAD